MSLNSSLRGTSGSSNSNSNSHSKVNKKFHGAQQITSTLATSSASRLTNFYQFACIVVVCCISYYNSTECGLAFDDISAVRDNKDLRPSTPLKNIFLNDFWGTPMRKEQSHKSYRPLTVLTYRLNYLVHELQPFGYHFVNLLLHILVCLLWRKVCRQLLLQCAGPVSDAEKQRLSKCSFLAALLFAVHPIHTEAVTGIVGRAELLSSIFYLLAFLIYTKASHIAALDKVNTRNLRDKSSETNWLLLCFGFSSCLLVSMLCKEQGVTIAGICVIYEIFVTNNIKPLTLWQHFLQLFEDKRPDTPVRKSHLVKKLDNSETLISKLGATLLKRCCFLMVVTIALLIGRVYVMGSQLPVFTRFDNPASVADSPTKQLTYSYLIYVNAFLLIFPNALCCDWTMGTIPLIESFLDIRNLGTVCAFSILFGLAAKACSTSSRFHSKILIMSLAWMVLPFIPASNLFFPVGFVVAERILYMPSMGFCLLVAFGYFLLDRKLQGFLNKSLKFGVLILLLSHIAKTHHRNFDWKNDYTLFMSGVKVNPNNAKLFNNVGHALENEKRFEEALEYFKHAAKIQEDDIGAFINVGRTYNNLQMYKEAENAYLKAKSLFPKVKPGESYQTRIAPTHLNVFLNLANLIAKNHTRLEEADSLYRQAISMRADYVQAYINRGDILMKLNRTKEAQQVYEKALLYDSENADIYYNLGVVFLEQGKVAQANVYFNKAIELKPEHEQALLNSAILLQELGGSENRDLSRSRLYKVLLKDDNNEKVYFNLGMLAMDEQNTDEAEQFFKRAIHIKSDFRSALFNLALLLAEANRSLEAVPFLNQLIRHHPDHIKGLILLGDIYINHMRDLEAAEECYYKILKIDPKNTQGFHNLCVVFVERKQLAKALACLNYAHRLAPHEDYIKRHLQIVQNRMKKILQLPEESQERKEAFHDYNPNEFILDKLNMT